MGLDFLRRTAPSFHRALDRRAIELRSPQLFAPTVPIAARTATASLEEGCEVAVGTEVLLRWINDTLVVQVSNAVVATVETPPNEWLSRVMGGGGIELGMVESTRSLSRELEISLSD